MAADGSIVIDTKINTDGLDNGFKDVEKELKKFADTTEDSGKTIERSFEDIGDAAKDAGKDIDRGITDSLDDVGDQAKDTGKKIERKLIEPIEEVGEEAEDAGEKVRHGLGDSFKEILSANLFSGIAVESLENIGEIAIDVAKDAIEAAAAIKAENAQFAQTFQGVEKTARESLNAIAEETGINATRMQESYTSIFAFTKTVGTETEAALDIANRAMIVAADSAAYYDRSIEEVTESLQSFLKGNFENDAALGIAATATTRNAKANEMYAKSFDRLTESQKVDVLLAMVEAGNKLSGALGQAARESDNWANVTAELSEAWKQNMAVFGEDFIEDLTPAIKWLTSELNEYVELRNKLKEKKGETNPLVDDVAAFELAAQSTTATVQQLRMEYDAAKEAAQQSLDAQIGLFDELVIQSETGAETIIANWQSQREAFAQYTENLKAAVNMGLDEALVQQLSDGSAESMSILNALVNDTDISVDDINAAFQGVSESRDAVASTMADIQTDMSVRLDELSANVESEWGEMSGIVGAEIANMQAYIDSLTGSTVYVDVVTRYFDGEVPTRTANSATGYSAEPEAAYAMPRNIPYLATGAVIPPNAPFYAVLGDQKHGTNLETPESLLRQIVREESGGGEDVKIEFTGELAALARILTPVITKEQRSASRSRGL